MTTNGATPLETTTLRDLLFADVALSAWLPESTSASTEEPWASFARARDAIDRGEAQEAMGLLRGITAIPGIEARHRLVAWHHLRALGVTPPPVVARRLLGVVVEVALPSGLDLLAAYSDHTARYVNWSGAGVLWNAEDPEIDAVIDALLAAGHRILERIGASEGPRPPPPPSGQVRLGLLTPSGLHFGQGPMDAFARDPLAGPLLRAAEALMQRLTARGDRSSRAADGRA